MMDNNIITESHEHCRRIGLDPNALPAHKERYSEKELLKRHHDYEDIIEIMNDFIHKFLSSVSGDPFFIAITDSKGYVLETQGDPSIIETVTRLGIAVGGRFTEDFGTNAPALCMRYNRPVQILGEQHYQNALKELACYSVPFYLEDKKQALGTLTLMTTIDFSYPYFLTLLCSIVDSFEREYLLRRHNTQLQILNQVMIDTQYYGVIMTDADGIIIEMNDFSHALLGSELGVCGSCIGALAYDIPIIGKYFYRVIHSREACVGIEIVLPVKDEPRYYMLDVVPVYDREQQLIRAYASVRDISEMKTTEHLLRKTEKLVFAGQLAVGIAHEIRNPMTTVKGMLQLSSKSISPSHYRLIMSEMDRMNAIINEFLILGRPQAEVFKRECCYSLLEEVLAVFEIQFETNGINIHCQMERGLTINCDRNQIKQAFYNILKNTIEALPFGGEVKIMLDVVNSYQRIRFADDGIGMTDEGLQRIGEPFYSTRPDGNGLGMMMVNKIVASHQGWLTISSEVGVGTTVEVFLPGS